MALHTAKQKFRVKKKKTYSFEEQKQASNKKKFQKEKHVKFTKTNLLA